MKSRKEINNISIDSELVKLFGIFNDECRLKILKLISKEKGLCVTNIAEVCGITVSAASQQLRLLEMGNVIIKKRNGQKMCFQLRRDNKLINKFVKIIN